MTIAALAALLLAAAAPSVAAPSAADRASLDAAVAAIYRPYAAPDSMNAAWEYPVFSARTAALIASWRKVAPQDEPDRLSDGDWFCLCQDWVRLLARVTGREVLGPNRASLNVHVELGEGSVRDLRMVFVRERGRWKLDDLFADPSFTDGLREELRLTIAEDTRK